MPFIVVPEHEMRDDSMDLHRTVSDAKKVAERAAVNSPGTRYTIFATVSSVFVPIPNPVWNEEQYVPEELK